jgi:hypothetical protein
MPACHWQAPDTPGRGVRTTVVVGDVDAGNLMQRMSRKYSSGDDKGYIVRYYDCRRASAGGTERAGDC